MAKRGGEVKAAADEGRRLCVSLCEGDRGGGREVRGIRFETSVGGPYMVWRLQGERVGHQWRKGGEES